MNIPNALQIGDRRIGPGCPTFITAEIGLNHNGNAELAHRMIQSAARSGVDAVKFQAFRADSFVSRNIEKAKHQKATLQETESLYDMWTRMEFSPETFASLASEAKAQKVMFYASAFDVESVRMLARLGVPALKVASGEVTNIPLVRETASAGVPIVMSVGMATLGEIEAALKVITAESRAGVALLHCVANYPVSPVNVHLRRIATLRQVFGVPVGYSDHTTSIWTCIASVAVGGMLIEKHFTVTPDAPGTDHSLSAGPDEMKDLVLAVREVEQALGQAEWNPLQTEAEGRTLFRRGLVAACSIEEGTVLKRNMVAIKRPAVGVAPSELELVLGRSARRRIQEGDPICWEDL